MKKFLELLRSYLIEQDSLHLPVLEREELDYRLRINMRINYVKLLIFFRFYFNETTTNIVMAQRFYGYDLICKECKSTLSKQPTMGASYYFCVKCRRKNNNTKNIPAPYIRDEIDPIIEESFWKIKLKCLWFSWWRNIVTFFMALILLFVLKYIGVF